MTLCTAPTCTLEGLRVTASATQQEMPSGCILAASADRTSTVTLFFVAGKVAVLACDSLKLRAVAAGKEGQSARRLGLR